MALKRLDVTPKAAQVIEKLKELHGELVFNQSGGCCDGTAPMCYEKGDFIVPSRNIKLGEICGCEFFIDHEQYEYFKQTFITIDVKEEKSAFGPDFVDFLIKKVRIPIIKALRLFLSHF
ncbi:DUF779 domain-containing protein, partial [Aliarcobacter butzleri]